jgi:membrane protease YdiL (CAAX protease family)
MTDDFDDVPDLRPLPPGLREREFSRDYDDMPRRPGFGFWMAVAWTLLYLVVTQIVAGIVFGIPIIGIAMIPEFQQNGMQVLTDPAKLNAWMQGPTGRIATLLLVAATQFAGLLLSWILLRTHCGKTWKRKIALTRRPTRTHLALVLVGIPALLAVSTVIDSSITRHVPSMQQILDWFGIQFEFQGAEMLPQLIGKSPWALAIFVIAVTPGICEEMFCRGFLGQGLSGRYRTWAVVLFVSFLFGCLHIDPRQGLGAMLLGAAIHGAYLATRSLLVAMFIHFANNGIAVVHYSEQLYPVLDPYEQMFKDSPTWFALSATVFLMAVGYALYQTRCKLVPIEPGMPCWEPKGVSGVELPPPNSGTIVTHDPLSPLSVILVLHGAVSFALVMTFA